MKTSSETGEWFYAFRVLENGGTSVHRFKTNTERNDFVSRINEENRLGAGPKAHATTEWKALRHAGPDGNWG